MYFFEIFRVGRADLADTEYFAVHRLFQESQIVRDKVNPPQRLYDLENFAVNPCEDHWPKVQIDKLDKKIHYRDSRTIFDHPLDLNPKQLLLNG